LTNLLYWPLIAACLYTGYPDYPSVGTLVMARAAQRAAENQNPEMMVDATSTRTGRWRRSSCICRSCQRWRSRESSADLLGEL
jgi:hypothetical protein